jgi:hypothetical protein
MRILLSGVVAGTVLHEAGVTAAVFLSDTMAGVTVVGGRGKRRSPI